MSKYIGLLRDDKKVEYNARFLLGDTAAEALELGKMYRNADFVRPLFLSTTGQNGDDSKHAWRCVDINGAYQ